MNEEPKPGSPEEMRKWIDIVDQAQKNGLGGLFGLKGCWAKIFSFLTGLAIILGGLGGFVQGVEAGRSFISNMHWASTSCPTSTNSK
jgi:hypothetical protein